MCIRDSLLTHAIQSYHEIRTDQTIRRQITMNHVKSIPMEKLLLHLLLNNSCSPPFKKTSIRLFKRQRRSQRGGVQTWVVVLDIVINPRTTHRAYILGDFFAEPLVRSRVCCSVVSLLRVISTISFINNTGIAYSEVLKHHPHVLCVDTCLLYTSPSPRDGLLSRMPSSA
eukprot:TRINITY_DN12246_c0_g1_i3.p1 TRINITY_DN12246_c0_g1~~TRINITY_DN12246_c0_g1_i3.p1  ORF type:complete len:189 (+),score=9.74 TRINITY_DN12246_c0_g1_i3:60-569(+)